ALLALTAAVFLAPAEAQASCGDYLVPGGHGLGSPARPPAPADPAQPCSGPHCSRAPLPITPAPLPPAPVRGDQAPAADPAATLSDATPSFLAPDEGAAHPVRRASNVFHPPRCRRS